MAAKKNKCEGLSHYQNFERHKRLLNLDHIIGDCVVGSVSGITDLGSVLDPDPDPTYNRTNSNFFLNFFLYTMFVFL